MGVVCTVELLGVARLIAGQREIALSLGDDAQVPALVSALAAVCPALVGSVVNPEYGSMAPGYILNRDGREFLTTSDAIIRHGDRLLVLSSAAGG
jgi:hypothetical protein